MVVADIRVKIQVRCVDDHFAQHPCLSEQVQGVVDRGERHLKVVRPRLLVQGIGCDVPVGAGKQKT